MSSFHTPVDASGQEATEMEFCMGIIFLFITINSDDREARGAGAEGEAQGQTGLQWP